MEIAVLVTLVASCCLLGLGLVVGLVTYPAFSLVDGASWPRFHEQHSRRITLAVGPPWLAQAIGLLAWLLVGVDGTAAAWVICAAAALAAVLLTVFGAVPIHERLSSGFDPSLLSRLLLWHWLRTACWAVGSAAAAWALLCSGAG